MDHKKLLSVLFLLLFCRIEWVWCGSLSLTLEQRVSYQKALEQVYWQHRIWPKENAQPKPALETIMPEAVIRLRTEDYLRKSYALDTHWKTHLTSNDIQAEINRIAYETRDSGMLQELFAALDNDAYVIAECLARPLLVDRLAHKTEGFDRWWADNKERMPAAFQLAVYNYKLPDVKSGMSVGVLDNEATTSGAPSGRDRHTAVWTGAEMIVWGGADINACQTVWDVILCFDTNTGGRYNPATNSWTATSLSRAPRASSGHSAIWTGTEMIIWGGSCFGFFTSTCGGLTSTEGRYNPATDTWSTITSTSAPSQRSNHSAVWTGTEMIIWGGCCNASENPLKSGARYDPATDSWKRTSNRKTPLAQQDAIAVWTGTEMIIWGGYDSRKNIYVQSGRRYDPIADKWTRTSATNAPDGRAGHSAVWTGTELVIWGGYTAAGAVNTGGRYDAATNKWTPTSVKNAPGSAGDSAVWDGNRVIVRNSYTRKGGAYDPVTDQWFSIKRKGSPSRRTGETTVWTGTEMIIWGGKVANTGSLFQNGGRHNATTNKWTRF